MIDLSYKPRKAEPAEKEPPMIVLILALAPFSFGLAWIILQGLC